MLTNDPEDERPSDEDYNTWNRYVGVWKSAIPPDDLATFERVESEMRRDLESQPTFSDAELNQHPAIKL